MGTTENYRQHLEILDGYLVDSLARAGAAGVGAEGVLFHAGRPETYHADDREIVFRGIPHFRRWVPLDGPEHVVLARPGERPKVIRVQPEDYWYDTSPPPASYWEEEVDLVEAANFEELLAAVGPLDKVAYVGGSAAAADEAGIPAELVEPPGLMAPLDWYRAYKTDFEVDRIAQAGAKAAAGHAAARQAFEEGGSEREVHRAYFSGSDQLEHEAPFDIITAFDAKAAILHYQHKRGEAAAPGRLALIDAGASCDGYASDVTRTWLWPGEDEIFQELLSGVDALERRLVTLVTPGRSYVEVHRAAHEGLAVLLARTGVVTVSADEAVDKGVTRAFLPHGVGHHLGLQVHDVGGRQAGPSGGELDPPAEFPHLRTVRDLEAGHVVTIEPGLYFIPMLLDPLRQGQLAGTVDWKLVDRLASLGGIRIEDDILCTEAEPRDLTRPFLGGVD